MPQNYSLEKLDAIAGGDESFIQLLVDTFLQEIPPDLDSMQEAINSGNHKMAYQYAHKMKPNLDMFGIDLLDQIAAMEKWSATDRPVALIKPQMDEIFTTLTTVINDLKADFK